jgi:hypothetical protein
MVAAAKVGRAAGGRSLACGSRGTCPSCMGGQTMALPLCRVGRHAALSSVHLPDHLSTHTTGLPAALTLQCPAPACLPCLPAVPGARDRQLWQGARQPGEGSPGQDCGSQEGGGGR